MAGNPIGRQILRQASHKGVVAELSQGTTVDQIQRLDTMVGTGDIRGGKLKEAIKRKAPGEMDKGIRKLQREGKEVTVDNLCVEVKSTPGFLEMCERAGLDLTYFENLARQRMEALKV